MNLYVLAGPTVEVRCHEKWCFGCRKRLPHAEVLLDYHPSINMTGYEPVWVFRCSGCGKDRTRFGS